MKNFIYKFEFFSGLFESCFYKQIKTDNKKEAIIHIVAFFQNMTYQVAENDIALKIMENKGEKNRDLNNWTVKDFYKYVDWNFNNFTEGYKLIWINEIDFDLNSI
jgi:CRISPR/Cas system-associated endonuclease Cas3-HD